MNTITGKTIKVKTAYLFNACCKNKLGTVITDYGNGFIAIKTHEHPFHTHNIKRQDVIVKRSAPSK
jgi:hypothetical protein